MPSTEMPDHISYASAAGRKGCSGLPANSPRVSLCSPMAAAAAASVRATPLSPTRSSRPDLPRCCLICSPTTRRTDRANVFDIALLADRLDQAATWVAGKWRSKRPLPLGFFGASTGAAAALVAAAGRGDVAAVVSRGGRPDLAGDALAKVTAATLLIVGGNDPDVLVLNQAAQQNFIVTTGWKSFPARPICSRNQAPWKPWWHWRGVVPAASGYGSGGETPCCSSIGATPADSSRNVCCASRKSIRLCWHCPAAACRWVSRSHTHCARRLISSWCARSAHRTRKNSR